jgi:hypothetical protein
MKLAILKKYESVNHQFGVQTGEADPEALVDGQRVLHLHYVFIISSLAEQ